MSTKQKINLLVALLVLLAVLGVIARLVNLSVLRFNLPEQSVSRENVSSINSGIYLNSVYGFSFNIPSGFDIDSSNIDAVNTPKQGFDEGTSYVQLFGEDVATGRLQKIEVYVQVANIAPVEFVTANKDNQIVVSNGVQWFVRKINAEDSSAVLAEALVPVDYVGIEEKYALVTIAGFAFNEDDISEYSEDMKQKVTDLVLSFKKS